VKARWWVAFLPFILGAACAPVTFFSSQQPIAEGLEGKSWGEAYALEPLPEYDEDDGVPRTFNTFDLKASGDWLALAATFYDASLGKYQGALRNYRALDGWGDEGSALRGVTSSTVDYDFASLIGGPGGRLLAVFLSPDTGGSGLTPISTLFGLTGSWSARFSSSQSQSDSPDFPSATARASDLPRHSGSFDPFGQVRFVANHNQQAWEMLWDRSHGAQTGIFQKESFDAADGSDSALSSTVLSDGLGTVCTSFEHRETGEARTLQVACRLLSDSSLTQAELVASESFAGLETLGHDGASNQDGVLVYVAYRFVDGVSLVTANTIVEGAVSDPIEISAAMTELGFEAAVAETADDWHLQARPRIVYLGENRFLAVWQGVASTGAGKVSQLFYATYDASLDEWSDASPFGDELPYSHLPAHYSFSLFGNDTLNAGVAVNRVDAESGLIHKTLVARYHFLQGWLEFEEVGAGCDASVSLRQCSMTPQGGILDSGQTVVAFVDQDEEGVFRLLGVNFE
jgi:hypothetical protein